MTPKFLQVVEEVEEQQNKEETKENYVINYLKSMITIEDAIEPYAEQKRELRAEYKEQGWLTKEEISLAVKAYRLIKNDINIDELHDVYKMLRGGK